MPSPPLLRPVALTSVGGLLYSLRGDGAVFVLVQRGGVLPTGGIATDPMWLPCPAVPGTDAAKDQEG